MTMTHYIDTFPGREIPINGKKYLYFGGTSYLGLQTNEEFRQVFIKNIQKYGTCYGASRKSNVRFSIYEKAENKLAGLVGSEACITLSSGYLAGQLVCKFFQDEQRYKLFYAPHSHPALFLSPTRTYTTFMALDIAVREHLDSKETAVPVVFMDTIDFSCGNYPGFGSLRSLPLEELILVADDSHGQGIIGEQGGGCHAALSALAPKELIVCGSLGKGWGLQGGAIFGNKKRIYQLMADELFGGSSPASPGSMATFLEAQAIYRQQRELLKKKIAQFKNSVKALENFLFMEGHPAFTFSNKELADYLEANRVIVTSFPYPSEDDPIMSRIVLSAHHTEKDIDLLVSLIKRYWG